MSLPKSIASNRKHEESEDEIAREFWRHSLNTLRDCETQLAEYGLYGRRTESLLSDMTVYKTILESKAPNHLN